MREHRDHLSITSPFKSNDRESASLALSQRKLQTTHYGSRISQYHSLLCMFFVLILFASGFIQRFENGRFGHDTKTRMKSVR